MAKTTVSAPKRSSISRIVADIHGVSTRYVNMIRNGERENEEIMATLVEYRQAHRKLIENLEKLVPIKPNPKKYARK
jgi:hypothetical protein